MKRLSKKEREGIKLPDTTSQALTGILLGDGHIQRRSPGQNSRFLFGQTSIKHPHYSGISVWLISTLLYK